MNTYQVSLEKSYAVTVMANSKQQARDVAEFYTGDIADISTLQDRKNENFFIEEIDCVVNEGRDVQPI